MIIKVAIKITTFKTFLKWTNCHAMAMLPSMAQNWVKHLHGSKLRQAKCQQINSENSLNFLRIWCKITKQGPGLIKLLNRSQPLTPIQTGRRRKPNQGSLICKVQDRIASRQLLLVILGIFTSEQPWRLFSYLALHVTESLIKRRRSVTSLGVKKRQK